MSTTGRLAHFSLAELLMFFDQGRKTGLLSIQPALKDEKTAAKYGIKYGIWIERGYIVASAATGGTGLLQSIANQRWCAADVLARCVATCPKSVPLGVFLRTQGLLSTAQIQQLFRQQMFQNVFSLFQISDGIYTLNIKAEVPTPSTESTGLCLRASTATLAGLRVLRNWDHLQHKLPPLTFGLAKLDSPLVPELTPEEQQIWQSADRMTSLGQIARRLAQSPQSIQRLAYRLIATGLLQEVPIISTLPVADPRVADTNVPRDRSTQGKPKVSNNQLTKLAAFLRSKV